MPIPSGVDTDSRSDPYIVSLIRAAGKLHSPEHRLVGRFQEDLAHVASCDEGRIGVEAESRRWDVFCLRQFSEIAACNTRVGAWRNDMAFLLEFDAGHNIVRGTIKGQLTDAIILDCQARATRYTKSHPPCRGIWDYSEVTEFQVSGDAVRQVERRQPVISTGYISIVVAPQDYVFGMMRMLQILSEESRPELCVVRSLNEAYRLPEVESPEFGPVAPE